MKEMKRKVQWDSKKIKALRTHLGLTQQGLADTMGTRQQTISDWEKDRYRPRGVSITLLNIVAEQAGFKYRVKNSG